MNEEELGGETRLSSDGRDVRFVDLMIVLAKQKRFVIVAPIIAALIAVVVNFAMPNTYRASAKLLPPQQPQSGAAAILSQIGGAAGVGAAIGGMKSPNDLYVGMLKSRTVADRLIQRFDLKKSYETDSQDTARRLLEKYSVITSSKEGLITIQVEDHDQALVARLANAYVDELTKLTRTLAITEASQRRLFFERELEQAKTQLMNAETSLKGGLEKHGVISVEGQSRTVVEVVARLKGQISAKEIQLNSMRAFVTPSNQDFRIAQAELNSLRTELSKLENGSAQRETAANERPAGTLGGLESVKLLRDVRYYQMLYEVLAKQYEVARLDEARDSSVIQVLDPAVPPERASKPSMSIVFLGSLLIGLFVGVILAFLAEAKYRVSRVPTEAAKWSEFTSHFGRKKPNV